MDIQSYKTSNGPHSASTYALMAVDQIIQVDPNATSEDAVAGLRLKADLIDTFSKVFEKCIKAERVEIKNDAKQMNKHMNPMPFMDEAYTEMVETARKSPSDVIKTHFSRDEILKVHAQTLANHFGTCIHVERSWWAAEHPDEEEAKIFKARYYG